jgi:hypothetical protein
MLLLLLLPHFGGEREKEKNIFYEKNSGLFLDRILKRKKWTTHFLS